MIEIVKKNWVKNKVLTLSLFGAIIALTILITISYKNIGKQTKKPEIFKSINQKSDIINFKKFILNQIKSPFINVNY